MALCVAWGRGEYGLEFKGFIDRLNAERENAHFWLNFKGMKSQDLLCLQLSDPAASPAVQKVQYKK
jgi:hypothetical protein